MKSLSLFLSASIILPLKKIKSTLKFFEASHDSSERDKRKIYFILV